MALTNRVKSSTAGALNLNASWDGGTVPTVTDRAVWNTSVGSSNISAAIGGNLTWGQLQVLPGTVTTTYTVTATAGSTLTLTPTDPDAANTGITLLSATRNLAMSCAVALGSDQTWVIGDTANPIAGRVLQNTGAISGGYSLTVSGPGQWSLSTQTNTFGGAGKTLTITNGASFVPLNGNSIGNSSNTIVVGNNGTFSPRTNSVIPPQTQIRVTGAGNYDAYPTLSAKLYGALLTSALTSAHVVTVEGTKAVIGFYSGSILAKITGSVTDYIEFMANSTTSGGVLLTKTDNDFYAPGGLRISSLRATDKVSNNYSYNLGATDAAAGTNENIVFGDARNTVRVLSTGRLQANPTAGTTRTVSRDITFDGDAANTAILSTITTPTSTFAFAGALTFSGAGGDVEVTTTGSVVSFQKSITGPGGLRLTAGTATTVEFNSSTSGAFSSWTGFIQAPLNAATYAKISYVAGYDTLTLVSVSAINGIILNNGTAGNITLSHQTYSIGVGNTSYGDLFITASNPNTTINLGSGQIEMGSFASFICQTANTTVVIGNTVTGQLVFGDSTSAATSTIVVSGQNIRTGANNNVGWSGGNLRLNRNEAFGSGSAALDNVIFAGTLGTLDNTSGSAVTLTNGAVKQFNGDFSWVGSNDLSLGAGDITWDAARTFTFTSGGGSGTLTLPGNATTTTTASTWNVGNQLSGGPYRQRLSLGGSNASLATTGSVTAGYFRIANNDGLGAAATTTAWYVGMTTVSVATVGAAIELSNNITVPATKNGSFRGTGPNGDGALRSVSGTNLWQGAILVPLVSGARFQVDAGTFTLSTTGSLAYTTIAPSVSATPLEFAALSGATMNQDRALTSTVGVVTVNSGVGSTGTVSFRAANANTGLMDVKAGTARFTVATAPGNGGIKIPANVTAQVVTSNYKATFAGTSTFGTNGSLVKATLKIGN